jgi:hypothetical protein
VAHGKCPSYGHGLDADEHPLGGSSACFAYVVENADKLDQIRKGDVISAVKVVDGMENFVPGGK